MFCLNSYEKGIILGIVIGVIVVLIAIWLIPKILELSKTPVERNLNQLENYNVLPNNVYGNSPLGNIAANADYYTFTNGGLSRNAEGTYCEDGKEAVTVFIPDTITNKEGLVLANVLDCGNIYWIEEIYEDKISLYGSFQK
jgi:hypothetical protein